MGMPLQMLSWHTSNPANKMWRATYTLTQNQGKSCMSSSKSDVEGPPAGIATAITDAANQVHSGARRSSNGKARGSCTSARKKQEKNENGSSLRHSL